MPENKTTPEPPTSDEIGTDEQVRAILDAANHHGRERKRQQRADFNEADYAAGVMTALFALRRPDRIPPMWIFGILRGEPQFGPEPWKALDTIRERGWTLIEGGTEEEDADDFLTATHEKAEDANEPLWSDSDPTDPA